MLRTNFPRPSQIPHLNNTDINDYGISIARSPGHDIVAPLKKLKTRYLNGFVARLGGFEARLGGFEAKIHSSNVIDQSKGALALLSRRDDNCCYEIPVYRQFPGERPPDLRLQICLVVPAITPGLCVMAGDNIENLALSGIYIDSRIERQPHGIENLKSAVVIRDRFERNWLWRPCPTARHSEPENILPVEMMMEGYRRSTLKGWRAKHSPRPSRQWLVPKEETKVTGFSRGAV
jgi:hypothetical protein